MFFEIIIVTKQSVIDKSVTSVIGQKSIFDGLAMIVVQSMLVSAMIVVQSMLVSAMIVVQSMLSDQK